MRLNTATAAAAAAVAVAVAVAVVANRLYKIKKKAFYYHYFNGS